MVAGTSAGQNTVVWAKIETPVKNLRTYGEAPFNIAVIHGGPGAAGEMAPVARELASG